MSEKKPLPIRQLRMAKKLTQSELALKLNVSVGTVSRWERGAFMPLPFLEERLRALLDVFPGDR